MPVVDEVQKIDGVFQARPLRAGDDRRTGRGEPDHLVQLLRRHGAQAVRGDAEHEAAGLRAARERVVELLERIGAVHEATLQRRDRLPAEVAVRIEHGQQRHREARGFRRADDAPCELRGIRVRPAVQIVMHVMEFGDRRVARLRHLDVGLRGDRLERVGVDAIDRRVHRLAPRPERVLVLRRRRAGATGDRALECMRMQVRHRRDDRPLQALARGIAGAALDALDAAGVVDDERDIRGPPVVEQRGRRQQRVHRCRPGMMFRGFARAGLARRRNGASYAAATTRL